MLAVGAAQAATYYVDSSAANGGNGSAGSPWNDLTDITGVAAGDTVLLKRGSVWRQTLTIGASGTQAARITFGAYGEGERPLIKASADLSGGATYRWTASGSGTNEYYLQTAAGGNPSLASPAYVWIAGTYAAAGTIGDLDNGQRAYGDNDSLGYNTLYIRSDAGDPDATGLLVESSARQNAIYGASRSGITIQDIDARHSISYCVRFATTSSSVTLQRMTISDSYAYAQLSACSTATLHRVLFERCLDVQRGLVVDTGASTVTVTSCIFKGGNGSGIYITTGGSVSLKHCTFIGSRVEHVYNTSTAVVTAQNCIFSAGGTGGQYYPLRDTSTGSITVSNSLSLPSGNDPVNRHWSGVVDGGGNVFTDPGFTSTRRPGVIVIMEDDAATINGWMALADIANADGVPVSISVSNTDFPSIPWSSLATYVAAGNGVASHTRGHVRLPETDAFLVQYVGTGSACTMTIDRATSTLTTTVTGGPGGEDLSIDLTVAPNDELEGGKVAGLVKTLDDHAAYTCTIVDAYNHGAASYTLAAVADVAIKDAPTTFSFDAARFYQEELDFSKSDIEANLPGYVAKALVYPGGYVDDTVTSYAQLAGYLAGRVTTQASSTWRLENMRIFDMDCPNAASVFGASGITSNTMAVLDMLAWEGGLRCYLSHDEISYARANWGVVTDAIAAYTGNVTPMNINDAVDYIVANGTDADGNGRRYTRVFADNLDMTLRSDSAAKDAGATGVGVTEDFLGNPIPSGSAPDMGALELQQVEPEPTPTPTPTPSPTTTTHTPPFPGYQYSSSISPF